MKIRTSTIIAIGVTFFATSAFAVSEKKMPLSDANHSQKIVVSGTAQAVLTKLDLATAESIALRKAPKIGEAYFESESAQQTVNETRSGLFPQITGIVSAVGTGNDIENAFGGNHDAVAPMRLGATDGLNNPTVYSRESNGLVVSQLITDFGQTSNLISAAKFESLSQQEKTRLARAETVFLVDEAYFKALGAQALLRVAEETVAARQLVFDRVDALTKSKLKSELDLSFARVNRDQANLLVIQAQTANDEAFAELSAAMGYREIHRFALVDQRVYSDKERPLESLIVSALQYRPEVVALRDESDAANKIVAARRDAGFPKITAMGEIGRTPVGDANVQGNYSAAGVNVELPIFTGGMLTARYKEAKFNAQAAQKTVEDMEDEVVKDVNEAWFESASTLKKIDVTKELLDSSNEALELAESRYKLGVTSIIELSQAQLNQTQAQIAYTSAEYEYQIDRARLDFESGMQKFRMSAAPLYTTARHK